MVYRPSGKNPHEETVEAGKKKKTTINMQKIADCLATDQPES